MLGDGPASSHPQNQLVNGYDHPFLFDDQRKATLYDPKSKRILMLSTTAPALVLYSGNQMNEETMLREGRSRKYYGVCLEPQHLPNAVHHSNFPSIQLSAGKTYHWETEYRVGKGVSR
jgi:aldose 1-epimerase